MRHIGFDFDLTIADTKDAVISSIKETFEIMEIHAHYDLNLDFNQFKGLKLREQITFLTQGNLTGQQLEATSDCYMRVYAEIGILKTKLFEGVQELFGYLEDNDFAIHVVSAKSQVNLRKSIEFTQLKPYAVIGGIAREKKSQYLIDSGCSSYVGDMEIDIEIANRAACKSILINYLKEETKGWKLIPDKEFDSISSFFDWIQIEENLRFL